jgi:PQQ-dependent catabolism-associated CXXCW motif protein
MTRHAVALVGSIVVGTCIVAIAGTHALGQGAPQEPSEYRMQNYRAPTPATLRGARVVSTAEAERLWQAGAGFIDVLPHAPRPASLPSGTIWQEKVRLDIPGSIWLPDTGYGALAAATENYLRKGLERLSNGDHARWLVFYCLRDCWMSWNAAKRALTMGYENVAWYPDGTDGWQAAGLPLQQAKPADLE